ncbi:MAG: cytochrome c family protein, partial [Alphaproteobacteria bacterium]|nr:cytochrome c family protein [Alphaproteobacteria bacterium]
MWRKRKYLERTMGKTLRIVSLFIFSVSIVLGGVHDADAKKKKKKFEITEAEHALLDKWEAKKTEKSRKKAVKKLRKVLKKKVTYVGATKCNGSCHDAYYVAWKESPHGGTYNLLKPGERKEAKERVKLDPEKDYTTTPLCLRCHTTGYKQRGGFKPAGSKNKKGKDASSTIDPEEPNKEQVG